MKIRELFQESQGRKKRPKAKAKSIARDRIVSTFTVGEADWNVYHSRDGATLLLEMKNKNVPISLKDFKRVLMNLKRSLKGFRKQYGMQTVDINLSFSVPEAEGQMRQLIPNTFGSVRSFTLEGIDEGQALKKGNRYHEYFVTLRDEKYKKSLNESEDNLPHNPVDPSGIGPAYTINDADYFGMRVLMKPSKFIELAERADLEEDTIEYLTNQLKEGNQLGNPFLYVFPPEIKTEEEKPNNNSTPPLFEVSAHEGRHRMMAIHRLYGDMPVEVHFIFEREKRARHITDEWIQSLTHMKSENGNIVRDPIERILR